VSRYPDSLPCPSPLPPTFDGRVFFSFGFERRGRRFFFLVSQQVAVTAADPWFFPVDAWFCSFSVLDVPYFLCSELQLLGVRCAQASLA